MPKKKSEKLVHLDIDELAHKTESTKEDDSSLGGILRAKRVKKRWEIEDVARKLRIKPIYLEALEQGHYYAFPARSYGVGFLRSYAKLLDLDPDKMTALFNQETNDDKEQPIDMLVMEKHFSLPSFKFVFAVLCVFFGLYLVWYGFAMEYYGDLFNQNKFFQKPIVVQPVEILQEESVEAEPLSPPEETAIIEENGKTDPPKIEKTVKSEQKEIEEAVYSAPVAFVATNTVWVGLKNTTTNKILVSKKFDKNESFIPETPLEELAVSTGRPKLLDLYIHGKKVKTFGRETWLPLAGFTDLSAEQDNN